MHAIVKIRKWGNSASVRVPSIVMKAACLHLDDTVCVREEGGCIILEPMRPNKYDLKQLLSGITSGNLHTEVNFGPAVGKEAL